MVWLTVPRRFGDLLSFRSSHVYFGLVMLCSSALNNLFVTYYLDYFLNVIALDKSAFYFGQVVFMTWNAINDPLFGWLSDRVSLGTSDIMSRRLLMIRYGGYLWCFAFFLVWSAPLGVVVSWWASCLHFSFVLCFYDSMLTLVEVNHSALLADISSSGAERAKMNAYSAVCAGIGSLSSFFGHWWWSRTDLGWFRLMAFVVSVFCAFVFHISCNGLARGNAFKRVLYPRAMGTSCSGCGPGGAPGVLPQEQVADKQGRSVSGFLRQLLEQRNFWIFQMVYFIQAFDCTFEKNHFSIFLDSLAGEVYSSWFLGCVITASFIIPWVVAVVLTPVIQQYGVYSVVQSILLSRVLFCVFGFVVKPGEVGGSGVGYFATWFLLINRVMSESVCRICPLIISTLVDEDKYLHGRRVR
mmetsp:Transcript_9139/g.17233  ORF Transcript_9139/g.17233 Transcript_9139/m.17233 type:complete len:411 (-) Transcript_9139:615-1847(-)